MEIESFHFLDFCWSTSRALGEMEMKERKVCVCSFSQRWSALHNLKLRSTSTVVFPLGVWPQVLPCAGLRSLPSALSTACWDVMPSHLGHTLFYAKMTRALLKRIHRRHRTFKCSAPHFCCSLWVSACIYQVPRPLHLTCGCTPSTPMQSRCTGVPLLSPTASSWSTSSCTMPTTRSLMTCGPCWHEKVSLPEVLAHRQTLNTRILLLLCYSHMNMLETAHFEPLLAWFLIRKYLQHWSAWPGKWYQILLQDGSKDSRGIWSLLKREGCAHPPGEAVWYEFPLCPRAGCELHCWKPWFVSSSTSLFASELPDVTLHNVGCDCR